MERAQMGVVRTLFVGRLGVEHSAALRIHLHLGITDLNPVDELIVFVI
jgi:hypothetical protein